MDKYLKSLGLIDYVVLIGFFDAVFCSENLTRPGLLQNRKKLNKSRIYAVIDIDFILQMQYNPRY